MKKKLPSLLALVCTGLTVIMALAWLFPVYWIVATALPSLFRPLSFRFRPILGLSFT